MTRQLFFNPQIEEQIKNIRRDLHLNMNGKVSESLENAGLEYKIIYGTQLPELRKIAQKYQQNAQLADCLWKMNIRETMILATMLYPIEKFSEEQAESWVAELPSVEMAEFLSMNLLARTDFAKRKIGEWQGAQNKNVRYLAYNLLLHIAEQMDDDELFGFVKATIEEFVSESATDVRNLQLRVINTLGVRSREFGGKVLREILSAGMSKEIADESYVQIRSATKKLSNNTKKKREERIFP